jgi:hypothetical protein
MKRRLIYVAVAALLLAGYDFGESLMLKPAAESNKQPQSGVTAWQ